MRCLRAARRIARMLPLLPALMVAGAAGADEGLVDVRLQLKWFHQFQFAGYYAALEKGYFREAGLNVTLLEGGPDVNPTEVVLAGDAEFGIGTSGLIVSRSRGRPVVAVAAVFQHSPYVLITRDEPELGSVRDLAGKRIMVEPYAEELIAYLRHEGLDIDDIVAVEHSGGVRSLLSGDIAAMTAYTTTEPYILDREAITYKMFDPKVAGIASTATRCSPRRRSPAITKQRCSPCAMPSSADGATRCAIRTRSSS